jgi:ubiquinone/menaquinone biosynthesis C-methylase UbiE
MQKKQGTSWGKEASWYSEHLANEDTYHAKVLLPNVLRLVDPKPGQRVLEIGCGEGFFTEEIAKKGGVITGCDISPELIALAKKKGKAAYLTTPAQDLSMFKDDSYDVVLAVLTLQNMERLDLVMKEVSRVLAPTGRFIFILNHPVIRIPQASSWDYDEKKKVQYRRLEAYLSEKRTEIDMHPGKGKKSVTYSFHRSLQEYMKLLRTAGFAITRLEEWISHKTSQAGPRAKAEDTARKEFPLFMMIEAMHW